MNYKINKVSKEMILLTTKENILNVEIFDIMRSIAKLNNIPIEWVYKNINEYVSMFADKFLEIGGDAIKIGLK